MKQNKICLPTVKTLNPEEFLEAVKNSDRPIKIIHGQAKTGTNRNVSLGVRGDNFIKFICFHDIPIPSGLAHVNQEAKKAKTLQQLIKTSTEENYAFNSDAVDRFNNLLIPLDQVKNASEFKAYDLGKLVTYLFEDGAPTCVFVKFKLDSKTKETTLITSNSLKNNAFYCCNCRTWAGSWVKSIQWDLELPEGIEHNKIYRVYVHKIKSLLPLVDYKLLHKSELGYIITGRRGTKIIKNNFFKLV